MSSSIIFPFIWNNTFQDKEYAVLNSVKYSPIHLFFAGHEAVILFFVLSGFVLSLPYLKNTNVTYSSYLIKRFLRLYIPYSISVLIATFLYVSFSNGSIHNLSDWFNNIWVLPIQLSNFIQHFTMLGSFNNSVINPIYWSLIHEMRISIIFPVIIYFILKHNWKLTLIVSFIWCSSAFVLTNKLNAFNQSDYLMTIYYLFMFIVGALLAKHKNVFLQFFSERSVGMKLIIMICAVLLYTARWWGYSFQLMHNIIITDFLTMFGSTIMIVISIGSKRIKNILLMKPINFIGKISYSLYLYHCVTLLTFCHWLQYKISYLFILVLSFVCAMILATLSYYYIEKPSIRLGKILVRKYSSPAIKNYLSIRLKK
ncbi:TPA: acyltransferase [Bacillus cereus]|nr:acyltransferase [Bacillus cereus]